MTDTPKQPQRSHSKRKCAKCRDTKQWSRAENVNGDGVLWHWNLKGVSSEDVKRGCTNCLAEKCMAEGRANGDD